MVYHFRLISNEVDDFIFEILIDSKAHFSDLHLFIQENLDFDKSQITSFFVTDDDWNKEIEITLLDMAFGESSQLVMDKTKLNELVSSLRQRLLYVFDLFSERVLFMELIEIKDERCDTPVCIRLEGEPPAGFAADFGLDLSDNIEDMPLFSDDDDDFQSLSDFEDFEDIGDDYY